MEKVGTGGVPFPLTVFEIFLNVFWSPSRFWGGGEEEHDEGSQLGPLSAASPQQSIRLSPMEIPLDLQKGPQLRKCISHVPCMTPKIFFSPCQIAC